MIEGGTRGIIFDYGNVLDYVDDQSPWLARRDVLAAQFNMTGDTLWKLLYETQPWQDCKRGRITYAEFWNRILSPLVFLTRASKPISSRACLRGAIGSIQTWQG